MLAMPLEGLSISLATLHSDHCFHYTCMCVEAGDHLGPCAGTSWRTGEAVSCRHCALLLPAQPPADLDRQ